MTLMPFWNPGIGLNSIKAGFAVQFPYKSASAPSSTAHVSESLNAVAPFEAILAPSEYVRKSITLDTEAYTAASGGYQTPVAELNSTGSVNISDGAYELMSHNFFAEVPIFFLDGSNTL